MIVQRIPVGLGWRVFTPLMNNFVCNFISNSSLAVRLIVRVMLNLVQGNEEPIDRSKFPLFPLYLARRALQNIESEENTWIKILQ